MTNISLKQKYDKIEIKRKILKEKWLSLKKNHGDKEEIKNIGVELTKLTFNQAHILIELEHV